MTTPAPIHSGMPCDPLTVETDEEPWPVPDGPTGATCAWTLVGCAAWLVVLVVVAVVWRITRAE